jgi:hypothetical protein
MNLHCDSVGGAFLTMTQALIACETASTKIFQIVGLYFILLLLVKYKFLGGTPQVSIKGIEILIFLRTCVFCKLREGWK